MNLLNIDEDFLADQNIVDTDKTIDEEMCLEPEAGDGGWIEDSSVPRGWKYKYSSTNQNILVKDLAGKKFNGRRTAILHLIKTNQDLEMIEVLDSGLEKEGWSSNQCLPTGWSHAAPIVDRVSRPRWI